MPTLAFLYSRFSSKQQAKGASLERQHDAAVSFAAEHNLTLNTKSYRDLGISAFKGRNLLEGALGTFMNAVKSGAVPKGSYLLVESLDRVSREEVMAALQTFLTIVNSDIVLVTLIDKRIYTKAAINASPMLIMEAVVTMARANEESATKSKRVRDSWERRRKKADSEGKLITGVCPPWLEPNADKTDFNLLHDKVEIVQRIYRLALEGWGVQLMARQFNKEKVPRLKKAAEWRAQEFVRLLKWEATKGVLVSMDGTYRNETYYPKIIEPDVWARVQQEMRKRDDRTKDSTVGGQGRKGETVSNLFSRMLRCGACGAGIRMTSRDRKHLRCLRAYAGANCSSPRFDYDALENEVLLLLLDDEYISIEPPSAPSVDPRASIRAELEDKNQRMERYVEQFETTVAPKKIRERIEELDAEIKELEQKLREWTEPLPVKDSWEKSFNIWVELNKATKWRVELDQKAWDIDFMAGKLPDEPRPEYDPEKLRDIRLRLQAGLKLLITRMNLLPRLHRSQLPPRFENRTVRFHRQVEVIGPVVEMLRKSTKHKYKFTEHGVLLNYQLPTHPTSLSFREKEWEAQGDADIKALEAKHGIATGLVAMKEASEEGSKPKKTSKGSPRPRRRAAPPTAG